MSNFQSTENWESKYAEGHFKLYANVLLYGELVPSTPMCEGQLYNSPEFKQARNSNWISLYPNQIGDTISAGFDYKVMLKRSKTVVLQPWSADHISIPRELANSCAPSQTYRLRFSGRGPAGCVNKPSGAAGQTPG